MTKSGLKLQKVLDAKQEELAVEQDPVKRDVILGQMIKAMGYRLEDHCLEDPLFKQRVVMTLSGFGAAIVSIAYGLWWVIQQLVGD